MATVRVSSGDSRPLVLTQGPQGEEGLDSYQEPPAHKMRVISGKSHEIFQPLPISRPEHNRLDETQPWQESKFGLPSHTPGDGQVIHRSALSLTNVRRQQIHDQDCPHNSRVIGFGSASWMLGFAVDGDADRTPFEMHC